ncbi:MAG TPA: histidine phosphatase family protein [Candidatus Limnocylindria bacterium]|nr:histidine phosphatase family protein [Candidatus Limnocylindria bacterium]
MSDPRLLLIRHGVTAWNREGRWQGRLDPPLSDDGRRQAQLLAARLAKDGDLRPARIFSSTLARAAQTAAAIAAATGVPIEPDPRLMEIGAGEWEGRTHDELEATDSVRYRAWRSQASEARPPGGEAIDEVVDRVRGVLAAVEATDGPWPAALVSHGGILRVVANQLFDLPGRWMWSFDVDNASVSVATRLAGGRWRLERWNDTLHLLGFEPTHVDEADGRPLAL